MNKETVNAWVQASRVPFFVATLIPLVLGGVTAYKDGSWNPLRWLAVLFACFLVHLCTNLANDYFDHLSGADAGESIGGSRVIQEGKISLGQLRTAMAVFYGIALACGVWVVWDSQVLWLIPLILFSFLSSLFYTAPPIRYGYLGLGELFVGINMGPVMVAGTAAAVAGHFVPRALWLSVPIGLMVAMILYYQSLPDIKEDRAVGKRTVAVRLGQPAAIWGMRFFVTATLLSVLALVLFGQIRPPVLISFVAVILAVRIDKMIASTEDWKDLHDRGGIVRMFYLGVGLIMILTVAWF
ncbi:MAG: 1,4-dihydroxy-2-naphthoate octaprenyltransferase [Desulfomonilaceae bacterium]|nr:1,4-dihydroxy-2-naphthoate octaprenyltransferase [Desulfomonilaceae bacterium]